MMSEIHEGLLGISKCRGIVKDTVRRLISNYYDFERKLTDCFVCWKIPHPQEYGCRDSFENTSNVETPINFLNFFLVMMFCFRFKEERNSQDETSKAQIILSRAWELRLRLLETSRKRRVTELNKIHVYYIKIMNYVFVFVI